MAQKDVKEKMALAIADTIKFAAQREENLIVGAEAVSKASALENRDFSKGGGFEEGDLVIFPSSKGELEECCILSGEKSISFLLQVERRGKTIFLRVYAQWLTLATHPLKEDNVEDSERWITHKGAVAEEARAYQGSLFGLFENFLKRKVKVVKVERLKCLVYKKGQKAPVDGRYEKEAGKRKFYTFEEVK